MALEGTEFSDTTAIVRVKRWFKRVNYKDRITKETVSYKVYLDWDLGKIDDGEWVIAGSPYQLFTGMDIDGTPIKDSRILITEQELPTSQNDFNPKDTPDMLFPANGTLHFKHPNI